MDRPFVIFQFGEGSSENVIFDLPPVLVESSNSSSSSGSSNTSDTTTSEQSSEGVDSSDGARVQRNLMVSISYLYSLDADQPQQQQAQQPLQRQPQRSGTMVLNVQNVPSNRTASQTSAMIEFAASIALSAIAASSFRRRNQVTKKTFEKFPLEDINTLEDKSCPICYESYVMKEPSVEVKLNESGKRGRDPDSDDGKSNNPHPRKTRRMSRQEAEAEASAPTGSANTESTSLPTESPTLERAKDNEEYEHSAVKLPCGHLFGRSCVFEWLQANKTCPLCRSVVHDDHYQEGPPSTINLPNISQLFDPQSRGRPMVVMLDRGTNTLLTRPNTQPSNVNISDRTANTTINISDTSSHESPLVPIRSSTNLLLQSPTNTRDQFSTRVLRSLGRAQQTDSIFSTGVSSRRRRDGTVETTNSDNNNTLDFYTESRRLLEERLALRSGTNHDSLLGFNSNGELVHVDSSSTRSDGPIIARPPRAIHRAQHDNQTVNITRAASSPLRNDITQDQRDDHDNNNTNDVENQNLNDDSTA